MKRVYALVLGISLAFAPGILRADVPDPMRPFILAFFQNIIAHPEQTFLFLDAREKSQGSEVGYPDPELQETYQREFNAAKTVTGKEWLDHFKITPSGILFLEVSQAKPFHFPADGKSEFGKPFHRAGRVLAVFTVADEYMGEIYDVVFHPVGSGKGNEVAGVILRAGPTIRKKEKDPCTIKSNAELMNPQL